MFGVLGWVRVGAAAGMREKVRRRERTIPGFYTPGTVSRRDIFAD